MIKTLQGDISMTNLLLRLFVPNWRDGSGSEVRGRIGKLSGAVGIGSNLLLALLKLIVGTMAGAVSITADAMNNLSDATSSVVTFMGFRLAEKPADDEHPYGHARFEYLSGLAVAAIIVVIGFELAKTSFEKILNPAPVEISPVLVGVLVGSIAVKLWLFLFNRRLGRHIGSDTLIATATDSRNDCVATGAVLIAALVEWLTDWRVDGFMGFGVALFILYSGITLGRDTISPLLGETASPEMRALIIGVVTTDPRVLGYHDLMVHDYGPGQRFASLHVEMDQKEDPLECHELIDDLERTCLEKHNIHLVIHYDPVVTGDPEMDRIRGRVEKILGEMDERITIHDFRMVSGKGHTNLIFDMALPSELMPRKKQLKDTLDRQLEAEESGKYYTVITFDMSSLN